MVAAPVRCSVERRHLLVLAALALALAPSALGQPQQASLHLEAEEGFRYVERGESFNTSMSATYTVAPPDYTATDGVRIRFEVLELPTWLVAEPDPADTRVFFTPAASPSQTVTVPFKVVGHVADAELPPGDVEILVRAVIDATRLQAAAEAEMHLVVSPRGNATAGHLVNATDTPEPAPTVTPPVPFWNEGAEMPLVTQSRHEEDLSGTDSLFLALTGVLGGYGGWRLKRRYA